MLWASDGHKNVWDIVELAKNLTISLGVEIVLMTMNIP